MYFILNIFDLSIIWIFFNNVIFTISPSLLKSTGTGTNLSTSNLSALLSNCLNQLVLFLIYQYLIYQLQILSLVNQLFQQIFIQQYVFHFLNLLLLHNQMHLIQLSLFFQTAWLQKIFTHLFCVFFTKSNIKRTIVAFPSIIYNHGHNIFWIFVTLPNFFFTRSETKCDYQ